jgi:hypothetical protein
VANNLIPLDETPEMRALWAQVEALNKKTDPVSAEGDAPDRVAASVPPSGSGDRDIDTVIATIAKLADGNSATATDVKLVRGDVATRAVRLMMIVQVGWGIAKQTVAGTVQVPGSTRCKGPNSASAHLAEVCGSACSVPAVSAGIADRVRKSPVKAFADWQDIHKIADLPHAAHYHENCANCSGHGVVTCGIPSCRNGKTGCPHCRETGKSVCHNCQGNRSVHVGGQTQHCRLCSGSGRFGTCIPCSGTATVNCMRCHGRGTARCTACDGHCTFTYVYRTYLEGRVSRAVDFDKGAPDGFRASCMALPAATMARGAGVLRAIEANAVAAEVSAVLHCDVRHAHVSMRVKDIGVAVDAIGTGMTIPLMPPFLDELIDVGGLTSPSDREAGRDPSARLLEATQASATKGILRMVGSGNTIDAGAFSRKWKGAISAGFVTLIEDRLRDAYSHAARSVVRRTWTAAVVPIAGLMILANAYHFPLRVFESLWPRGGWTVPHAAVAGFVLAQTLVALPVVSAVRLYAGNRARASLRAAVGGLAQRRPIQGIWPWLGLLAAVAAGWMAVVLRVEAAGLGLPFAPPALVQVPKPAAAAIPARPTATQVRQTPVRDRLHQSR